MEIDFAKVGGLIPAIVQDDKSGEVLMLGFMNQEAYAETQATGTASVLFLTIDPIGWRHLPRREEAYIFKST